MSGNKDVRDCAYISLANSIRVLLGAPEKLPKKTREKFFKWVDGKETELAEMVSHVAKNQSNGGIA